VTKFAVAIAALLALASFIPWQAVPAPLY